MIENRAPRFCCEVNSSGRAHRDGGVLFAREGLGELVDFEFGDFVARHREHSERILQTSTSSSSSTWGRRYSREIVVRTVVYVSEDIRGRHRVKTALTGTSTGSRAGVITSAGGSSTRCSPARRSTRSASLTSPFQCDQEKAHALLTSAICSYRRATATAFCTRQVMYKRQCYLLYTVHL